MYLNIFVYIYLGVSLSTYKPTEAVNACPNGWNRYDGSCYHIRYSVEGVDWKDAATYCEGLGANLPIISSPIDNIEFYTRIQNLRRRLNLDVNDPVFTWLGYRNTGNGWRWVENSKVSTYEYFKSDNLVDPEPGMSKCGAMYLNGLDTGYWDDFDCEFSLILKYVTCERNVEPNVRLADGPTDLEGRVEVKVNGRWGTVCDDFWTTENSDVVCRQLGYPMSILFRPGSPTRAGEGKLWLDNVKCTGEERFVTSCPQAEIDTSDCEHKEDIWIKCSNETQRGAVIPKWFSATENCYDWDSVCDGNCYSVCGDQSLVQEVDSRSKSLRVITTHVDLSSLGKFIPEGYGDITRMDVFSQNVILSQNLHSEYHLQVVTRRLQLRDTDILNYDHVTNCYRIQIINHEDMLYYVFHSRRGGYSVDIYAETIDNPESSCLHLTRSSSRSLPIIPVEYISLSATCVGVQSLSLDITNNEKCEKGVMLDTINSIINMKPSREISEWVINIKTKVLRRGNEVRFVPSLSHSSYETLLETYQNDLEILNNGLQRFKDKDTDFDDKLEILELFKSNAEDVLAARELEYFNGQNEIAISRKTIELLQNEFEELKHKLNKVRKKFESDVKKYTIRKSFTAFFNFVEGIANVFASKSNPGILDVGGVLVESYGEISKIITDVLQLFKTIDDVNSYIDGNSQLSPEELDAYITSMRKFANLKLSVLAWQSLENAADGLLSQGKVTEIRSAGEYRQIVSDVADYGRAITEEMIRHTQLLLQSVEDMQWLSVSKNEVNRLEGVVEDTNVEQLNHGLLLSELDFQTYFLIYSIKETVNTFCKSKFYYQFTECDPASLPEMSDSMRLVRQKLGSLIRSQLQGLTQFVYGRTQPIFITKTIRDKRNCARRGKYSNFADCPILSLKRKNNVYFSIHLNSTEFLDLYRVRIDKIRVFLNGDIIENEEEEHTSPVERGRGKQGGHGEHGGKAIIEEVERRKKVRLNIQTTGVFYDRHGTRDYEFTGVQVNKKFEYWIGQEETPILDGDIYSNEAESYVNTTPFTTWSIRVPEKQNRELDLNGLSNVKIHFYGTAVVGY